MKVPEMDLMHTRLAMIPSATTVTMVKIAMGSKIATIGKVVTLGQPTPTENHSENFAVTKKMLTGITSTVGEMDTTEDMRRLDTEGLKTEVTTTQGDAVTDSAPC